MAVTASPTAKPDQAKKTRAKKEDALVFVDFVNDKNERTKRIPENVHSLVVTDKNKNSKTYVVKELQLPILVQLATDALRRRFKVLKPVGDKSVLQLAEEIYTNAKAGKLYVGGDGAPRQGRSFDVDLWVDAVVAAASVAAQNGKAKPISKKGADELRVKLSNMSPTERKTVTAKWGANPLIKRELMKIRAARADQAVKDAGDGDFNSILDI